MLVLEREVAAGNERPGPYEGLRRRIEQGRARVGIIGMGYVGLPLGLAFARRGTRVLGFDTDPSKIARLRGGESYIKHVPAEEIDAAGDLLEATDQFDRLSELDAILICVPTPLSPSRDPDLSFVEAATRAIAARLRPGQLVVLESTTYPGTTRHVVLPLLEASGLEVGRDFFLAFSPEREDPGNTAFTASAIPKVVGGIDPQSLDLAAALYGRAVSRVVCVSAPEVAEASKILENTYRAVNIALVNELKVLYDRMDIDIWEVIRAAATKPFGFQAFSPGPGIGGHCIPVDPFYLSWIARRHGLTPRFIELAGEVNSAMPAYVVDRVAEALNRRGRAVRGSRILLLGMAYKRDVDDARESPGLELMELLLRKGADVEYNDPHIPALTPMGHRPPARMTSRELTEEYLASRDCVVIATDHSAYRWPWIVRHSRLVVDTRNATYGLVEFSDRIVRA